MSTKAYASLSVKYIPAVVVRLDHGVCALASHVIDLLRQVAEVCRVRSSIQAIRDQTFHVEVDAKGVESTADERIVCRQRGPNEFLAVCAWENAVAKLWSRLVDADPLHLAGSFGIFAWGGDGKANGARGGEQRKEVHVVEIVFDISGERRPTDNGNGSQT